MDPRTVSTVTICVEDGVGQLILARPEKLNAVDDEMMSTLGGDRRAHA
jgi:enoyl-CoA hydratase/carnithine racemase